MVSTTAAEEGVAKWKPAVEENQKDPCSSGGLQDFTNFQGASTAHRLVDRTWSAQQMTLVDKELGASMQRGCWLFWLPRRPYYKYVWSLFFLKLPTESTWAAYMRFWTARVSQALLKPASKKSIIECHGLTVLCGLPVLFMNLVSTKLSESFCF